MGRTGKIILVLVCLAIAAGAAWWVYRDYWSADAQATRMPPQKGRGGMGAGAPTPVIGASASLGSVDIVITGLGTATPLRTVTVRSRVDGELMRVLFQEGELVKEGQLLAEIDPRSFKVQLEQAEGQLARDRALLENAKLDLERYQSLFKQDSIAKQQVDTQMSLVRQYEGAVRVDRSQIDSAKLQLSYTKVTAPVAGRVGLRLVDQGNIVRAGDANGLVVITQLQPVAVLFTVPQDSVPVVMRRMQSGEKIPVEAWDREQKTKLADGELVSADNQVDPATGTVKLKAQFANDDRALFPNQFVNVRMKLDTLRDIVVIPSAAVQRGAQGLFVYVVRPDNTVTQRVVKLGPAEGLRVAVNEGLAAGEVVVVDGMDRLRPGAPVEVSGARPEIKPPPEGARKGKGKGKGEGRKAQ
ncbi:MAG: rane fusion protein multidrug efflux system [Betaproteobacteria bacterium]|jgi:multidrug efflux system membrane fusion protein|nr:rane fusion protein multidrug efflux system [Betaproteobacteria bacterium]